MGKDLRGKELGVGISQRKDGMYTGRFTTKSGKRKQKYFHKLQECRAWMADAQFEDEHGDVFFSDSPTVDAWFDYWIEEVKGNSIKLKSKICYQTRWRIAISPVIGNMELKDVKPIHCQNVLNRLNQGHKISYIRYVRTLLSSIMGCAVENGFIQKNPVVKSVKPTGGEKVKEREPLTLEEQRIFLEFAKKSSNYNFYALALQTGMRCGELAALTWDNVDFNRRMLKITKSLSKIDGIGIVIGEPKTESAKREIPLTEDAIRILKMQKERIKNNKIIPIKNKDFVFLNKNGNLIVSSNCDSGIKVICKNAGIRRISIHNLRHTFATRCIEGGMRPKTLQTILGHKKLETTMDLYVHVTEDSKAQEISLIEEKIKLV